ncbi:hypothetical protein M569_15946 [Genlisea aurea]|uniref:PWWP domain-containing protein n=1 Tax=Genlisea aurea TaxID=192259 RepID=S8C3F0_9LAMI|nr:hypothetical protein M569_15946 [Genlisea aurea]
MKKLVSLSDVSTTVNLSAENGGKFSEKIDSQMEFGDDDDDDAENGFTCVESDGVVESEPTFVLGDLVWARTRTGLWWPGVICDPSTSLPKSSTNMERGDILVKYFCNPNHAWCGISDLKSFSKHFDEMSCQSNSVPFRGAVRQGLNPDKRSKKIRSQIEVADADDSENGFKSDGDIESEATFDSGDFVWARTRKKLWWPGVICDPSTTSAYKPSKIRRGNILVKYFSNRNHAWCGISDLKSFSKHFDEMSCRSDSNHFSLAVDRAVSLIGELVAENMSCPCFSNGKKWDGNSELDVLYSPSRFEARKFLSRLRDVARNGGGAGGNKLESSIVMNHLFAFYRFRSEDGSDSRSGTKRKHSGKEIGNSKSKRAVKLNDSCYSSSEMLAELRSKALDHSKCSESLTGFYFGFRKSAFESGGEVAKTKGDGIGDEMAEKSDSNENHTFQVAESVSVEAFDNADPRNAKIPFGVAESVSVEVSVDQTSREDANSPKTGRKTDPNGGISEKTDQDHPDSNENRPSISISFGPSHEKQQDAAAVEKTPFRVAESAASVEVSADQTSRDDSSNSPKTGRKTDHNGGISEKTDQDHPDSNENRPSISISCGPSHEKQPQDAAADSRNAKFPFRVAEPSASVEDSSDQTSPEDVNSPKRGRKTDPGTSSCTSNGGISEKTVRDRPENRPSISVGRGPLYENVKIPFRVSKFASGKPNLDPIRKVTMAQYPSIVASKRTKRKPEETVENPSEEIPKNGEQQQQQQQSAAANLILEFDSLPPRETLIATLSRFGLVRESEIEAADDGTTVRIPYERIAEARFAFQSLEKNKPFGDALKSSKLDSPTPQDHHQQQQQQQHFTKTRNRPSISISTPGKVVNPDDVGSMKRNVEKMRSTLEKAGAGVSVEMRSKLENDINSFLEKVRSMSS